MEYHKVRLGIICACLSLFCFLPVAAEVYFPNNAYQPLQEFLRESMRETTGLNEAAFGLVWTLVVTGTVGSVVGSALVPHVSSRLDRRQSGVAAVALLVLPARLCELASVLLPELWPLYVFGRVFGDLAIGLFNGVLPPLVSEVAPRELRGRLGILLPLGHSLGAVLGTGLGLAQLLGTPQRWPYAEMVFLALSCVAVPLLLALPPSPTLLLARAAGDDGESREAALQGLRFYQGPAAELDAAQADADLLRSSATTSWASVLGNRHLRPQLRLVAALAWTYFPVVLLQSFSTAMLADAGLAEGTAEQLTLGLKVFSVAAFVLCLAMGDRLGRRRQLLLGIWLSLLGMAAMGAAKFLGTSFPTVSPGLFAGSLFLLQLGLNVGVRPLYWVIVPEIFPFRQRAPGKSLANATSGTLSILVNFAFYQALGRIKASTYVLLSLPLLLSAVYLSLRFPETSGRELHEIFEELDEASGSDAGRD